jgi:hypothetical protein
MLGKQWLVLSCDFVPIRMYLCCTVILSDEGHHQVSRWFLTAWQQGILAQVAGRTFCTRCLHDGKVAEEAGASMLLPGALLSVFSHWWLSLCVRLDLMVGGVLVPLCLCCALHCRDVLCFPLSTQLLNLLYCCCCAVVFHHHADPGPDQAASPNRPRLTPSSHS